MKKLACVVVAIAGMTAALAPPAGAQALPSSASCSRSQILIVAGQPLMFCSVTVACVAGPCQLDATAQFGSTAGLVAGRMEAGRTLTCGPALFGCVIRVRDPGLYSSGHSRQVVCSFESPSIGFLVTPSTAVQPSLTCFAEMVGAPG
jgi:hypothetical protein